MIPQMLPHVQAKIAARAAELNPKKPRPVLRLVELEPAKPVDTVQCQVDAIKQNWAAKTVNDFFHEAWAELERSVTVDEIKRAVCKYFDMSRADLDSPRRQSCVVIPRQIGMYLAKTLTPRSYPDIGRRFGGRDHTTVLHAHRQITAKIVTDEKIRKAVTELTAQLKPWEV